jgi:biotin carboxyl carrier protein
MSEKSSNAELALEAGNYETRLTKKFLARKPYEKPDPRVVKAVIPGVIAEIDAEIGKRVKRGETLLVLEAMKMRNLIAAPHDGVVRTLHVVSGDKVVKGQVLVELE